MPVLYAFRPPEHFSSGMCSKDPYNEYLCTAIIDFDVLGGRTATPISGEFREIPKMLSSLPKVLETCFWAQNDRNGRVYISTYNNFKL